MKLKVGDILYCKHNINAGMKNQGVFYYNRPYEVAYVDKDYIHMIAENGGNYLFFQDNYESDVIIDRKISDCFWTEKELRLEKLKRL